MSKYILITLILLTAVLISGGAYCQQVINDRHLNTISGQVTRMDVEGYSMDVKTDKGIMTFYISVESELIRHAHHMAAIEIELSDPVVIQYDSSSGKNVIISMVDNRTDKYTFAQFFHAIMNY